MTGRFILYGAGGHARVLLDLAKVMGVEVSAIVDDAPRMSEMEGVPIMPSERFHALDQNSFLFTVAIGQNLARGEVFSRLLKAGQPSNLIHPFTSISTRASMGRGVAIMPGVVINTGAVIGDNCIINTSASVDHDCRIHSHVHLCPGVCLAGNVTVGTGSMLGTGTCVIPGISIGKNCLIGGGSVVVRDIPDHSVAFGNPAKVLRANSPAFI